MSNLRTLKLSAPWETFYKELNELFRRDPDVDISFEEHEEKKIRVYVRGERKSAAIAKILPTEKTFGNVTVKIDVIPDNNGDEEIYNLYRDAFEGNTAVEEVRRVLLTSGGVVNYVIFENRVVQFFNDDISDPVGLESTLYENIARKVLINQGGEYYSTGRKVIGEGSIEF